jgi:TolB protein
MRRDLALPGRFNLLDPRGFLADLQREQMDIRPDDWTRVGAQGVIKTRVVGRGGRVTLDARFYEPAVRGAQPTLEKTYQGAAGKLDDLVHRWCDDLVENLTGEKGVFRTKIVYARPGRRTQDLMMVDASGGRPHVLVSNQSQNLLPAWAPTGDRIAYTSLLWRNPDQFILPLGDGRAQRVSKRPGLNSGGAFSPDGSRMVLTLSKDGNAEMYLISAADGSVQRRLTNHEGIDTSPALSRDGSELAFVSNRHGTPQIWVMPAGGGEARRVTLQGRYNQSPRWNPRPGTRQLAFTGQDERGRFDVFVLDLETGKTTRVTQNQGDNWEPTWAPNGRLLAFKSGRGGLWVATPQGAHQVQIVKGAAETPAWSPFLGGE